MSFSTPVHWENYTKAEEKVKVDEGGQFQIDSFLALVQLIGYKKHHHIMNWTKKNLITNLISATSFALK